jgi:hypothetical protein
MNYRIFKWDTWLNAFLVLSIISFYALAETTTRDELLEYDTKREAAWRERFEDELRRSGVHASEAEKEAAFKEYMTRVRERAEKQKELIEEGNRELVLRGQVLDQDGQPVSNAEVAAVVQEERTIGIGFHRLQTIKRDVVVKTDASGNFTLDGGRGRWISIQNISAPGYEFVAEQQTARDFYADESVAILKPQGMRVGKERVVLKAWKQKGQPDKLVIQEVHFRVAKGGEKQMFNVLHPRGKKMLTEVQEGKALDGDLLFAVMDSGTEDRVLLRIEAVDGGVSDHNSSGFIAPAEGYSPVYDMDVTKGEQQATVFVRSRDGMIYTRLSLNAWYDAENSTLSIGMKYASNPHGRTNLQPNGGEYRPHVLPSLEEELSKKRSEVL